MKELRRRLERERQAMAVACGSWEARSPSGIRPRPADSVWDEADHIQASEQRDMGLAAVSGSSSASIDSPLHSSVSRKAPTAPASSATSPSPPLA